MSGLAETLTYDQAELKKRRAELRSLEKELSRQELALSTLQHQVRVFEEAYERRVGAPLRELDRLKADILELAARLDPRSETLRAEAESARRRVTESDPPCGEGNEPEPETPEAPPAFEPGEEVKKLFREAAKRFHPDLSTDPEECARRHDWMARLNQAYLELDGDRIQRLIDEWEAGRPGADAASLRIQLSRVLKQIGQVRHRLHQIGKNLEVLRRSDMARLMDYAEKARREGRDVLNDLAEETREKIGQLKTRVSLLASDCALL